MSTSGILLLAATNRIDVLDPALLRPGRISRRVVVPVPDQKGRQDILTVHLRDVPMANAAAKVEVRTLASLPHTCFNPLVSLQSRTDVYLDLIGPLLTSHFTLAAVNQGRGAVTSTLRAPSAV